MSNEVNEIDKFIKEYKKFHTVVLLDELCILSNSGIRCFSLETCQRITAIKKVILQRTKKSSADKQL